MRCPHSYDKTLRLKGERAFTLIENLVATTIVILFFGALYAISSQGLNMLNAGRGAVIASECLQDRTEQLRSCTWSQLTDANYLKNNVLNTAPNGISNLGTVTEKVTIDGYPAVVSPPISVVRSNGTVMAVSNGALANRDMVRVDMAVTWSAGIGGRTRTQAVTTLIAKSDS